jgi:hypothetical protein
MASQDEVIRLILDGGQFESTVAQLQKSTDNYKGLIEALNGAMAAGDVSVEHYAAQLKTLGAEYTKQAQLLAALKDASAAAMAEKENAARQAAAAAEAATLRETAALKAEARGVYDLADAYEVVGDKARQVSNPLNSYGQSMLVATAGQRAMVHDTDEAGKAIDRFTQRTDGARNKVANFGQSALQAGRVVQDFTQGGIGGILNNIEGLAMALGGGAGLAGILTIVGTGLFILKPHIQEIGEALGLLGKDATGAGNDLENLQERIKEIGKNPVKLTVDKIELEQAKKEVAELQAAMAALKKIEDQRESTEEKSGKAVADELGNNRGSTEALRTQLRNEAAGEDWQAKLDKLRAQIRPLQEELKSQQASGSEGASVTEGMLAPLKEQERAILKAVMDDAEAKLARITNDAVNGKGDEQTAAQKELADRLRKAGKGDVADAVVRSSPEALKKKADDELNEWGKVETETAFEEGQKKAASDAATAASKTETAKNKKLADAKKKIANDSFVKQHMPFAVFKDDDDMELRIAAKRAAMAEAATKKTEADKANAEAKAQATLQEQIEAKDNATLEKGLGDQFIGQAHSQRLGIEENQFLSKGQKAKARKQFDEQVRKAAKRQLQARGVDPDEAERLSGKAGGFLGKDLDKQFNQADARFDQADGVEGGNNRQAVAQFVQEQIQQGLAAMALNGQAGRARAPQGARRQPRRGGGMKSVGLRPAPGEDQDATVEAMAGVVGTMGMVSGRMNGVQQNLQAVIRDNARLAQEQQRAMQDMTFLPIGPN